MTFGHDKEKAIDELSTILKFGKSMQNDKKIFYSLLFTTLPLSPKKSIRDASRSAAASLEQLRVRPGMFAGLPWFFQNWGRDTYISFGGMLLLEKENYVYEQLMKDLPYVSRNLRLYNREPSSDLGSADGIGWYFLRAGQLLTDKKYDHLFTEYERRRIIDTLTYCLPRIEARSMRDGLFWNGPNETWMDTSFHGDTREGFRIEIQAMMLAMYRLAFELTGNQEWQDKEEFLRERVLEVFWNGKYLADGKDDWTIRPNIFLAAYVYPHLLIQNDWKTCIRNVLPHLWLPWGGLSTIDISHPLFCAVHSGENNQSYHRGDSWYYLNNLSALVMNDIDSNEFSKEISSILRASTDEILLKGCLGCHAEISGATHMDSFGCLSQAWSNALYVELVHALFGKTQVKSSKTLSRTVQKSPCVSSSISKSRKKE